MIDPWCLAQPTGRWGWMANRVDCRARLSALVPMDLGASNGLQGLSSSGTELYHVAGNWCSCTEIALPQRLIHGAHLVRGGVI